MAEAVLPNYPDLVSGQQTNHLRETQEALQRRFGIPRRAGKGQQKIQKRRANSGGSSRRADFILASCQAFGYRTFNVTRMAQREVFSRAETPQRPPFFHRESSCPAETNQARFEH